MIIKIPDQMSQVFGNSTSEYTLQHQITKCVFECTCSNVKTVQICQLTITSCVHQTCFSAVLNNIRVVADSSK